MQVERNDRLHIIRVLIFSHCLFDLFRGQDVRVAEFEIKLHLWFCELLEHYAELRSLRLCFFFFVFEPTASFADSNAALNLSQHQQFLLSTFHIRFVGLEPLRELIKRHSAVVVQIQHFDHIFCFALRHHPPQTPSSQPELSSIDRPAFVLVEIVKHHLDVVWGEDRGGRVTFRFPGRCREKPFFVGIFGLFFYLLFFLLFFLQLFLLLFFLFFFFFGFLLLLPLRFGYSPFLRFCFWCLIV
mmetsp:Transcript_19798/g.39232  ORF Transcript_19798/g.39232 Transcript_19798/m.39232 type:complete len:242 (-) Transcript_19798:322-1047(-)